MDRPEVFSAGFIVFRRVPRCQFLLMKHPQRWDLPKGHLDEGENDFQAAVRELAEETGILLPEIDVDHQFSFTNTYYVPVNKNPKKSKLKKLTIFLAWWPNSRDLTVTEHEGYEWFDWTPPHAIQANTIDPVLAAVEQHFLTNGF